MNKTIAVAETMLRTDEMKQTKGGGIGDLLVRFAIVGSGYFYNMGVQEGRRMKAQL
jgi:hypothetical protein